MEGPIGIKARAMCDMVYILRSRGCDRQQAVSCYGRNAELQEKDNLYGLCCGPRTELK